MSSLSELLSAELLNLIIGFIDHLPSLAVLARVSKLFNRLTLPHLYANVSLVGAVSDMGTKHLRPFAFLMLQQPQLAALVRTFTLRHAYRCEHIKGPIDWEPGWIGWPDTGSDAIIKTAIKAHLGQNTEAATGPVASRDAVIEVRNEDAVRDEAEQWFQIVRAGFNEAAIFALLLPNLINLQSIDVPFQREYDGLGEGFSVQSQYIMKMFEQAATRQGLVQNQPSFGALTDIMIPGYDDKYPDDPDFYGACAGLPAIKRLFGFNQGNEDDFSHNDDNSSPGFSRLEPGSSPLEFIELRKSKLNVSNFSKLLRAPTCLKTFIYEIGNTWAWTQVKFSQIQRALDFQAGNLERLCLSHDDYYPFVSGVDDELMPMTLSGFSILKHLRIAPVYLYGGDRLQLVDGDAVRNSSAPAVSREDLEGTRMLLKEALPEQLETLELMYCNDASTLDRLLISLDEVLSWKEEKFSSLHEVSIHAIELDTLMAKLGALKTLPWRAKSVRLIVKTEAKVDYEAKNYRKRKWGWDEKVEWADGINNLRGPIEILYDTNLSR